MAQKNDKFNDAYRTTSSIAHDIGKATGIKSSSKGGKLLGALAVIAAVVIVIFSGSSLVSDDPVSSNDPVTPITPVTPNDPVPDSGNYEFLSDFVTYDATVTPFTFPESRGIPVYDAIKNAKHSISISIYLLSSKNVLALLNERVLDKIEVRVLVDGTPLGVNTEDEFSYLLMMDKNGADVRVINYTGVPQKECRYVYNHSKYMVVDDETVVVTSENWTTGNMSSNSGNRGWGVVVESNEYAAYMNSIFEKDFTTEHGDVKEIEYCWDEPCKDPVTYTEVKPLKGFETKTYAATVSPVHSPDTSFAGMKAFINSAKERLYIEELSFGAPYSNLEGDNPAKWLADLAKKGVDVKAVLDCKESDANQKVVDMFNKETSVKAAAITGGTGFGTTHNKGIIADSMSWVGSINMTKSSVEKNREVSVMIYSEAIAEYFAGYFNTDFDKNYKV
ncbi:MAG: phospholipase D-like domain-containing protein [archaeon]|nr:phospholipase D-like domain-containing protein [archaeon]